MSDDGLFKPFPDRPQALDDDAQFSKAYTLGGKEVPLDNPEAYAKHTSTAEGTNMYYLKVGGDGMLYNPHSIFGGSDAYRSNERNEGLKWRKVSQKCFNYYKQFLDTRNPAWLRNAEREVIDG